MRFRLTAETQLQIVRAIILTGLFAVPGIFGLHVMADRNSDLWWHLASGEWIVAHHAVPQTDPFSAYGAGRPWVAYSWLFEVLLFKLYQLWNLVGAVVYTVGMITFITAALHRLIRGQLHDFVLATLLTIAAMDVLLLYGTPRPWLITILLFIFEFDILMHARRTGDQRGLFVLPVLFAVWANMHIEFIAGLLVLGLAAIEPLVEQWWPQKHTRLRSRSLWTVFAACVAATLVNPYGWHIYQVAYQLVAMPGAADYVAEMGPIPFRSQNDFVLLFLAFFCVAAVAWIRRIAFFEIAVLALAITSAFHSARELWLLTVTATTILASVLPATEPKLRKLPLPAVLCVAVASCAFLWGAAASTDVNNAQLRRDLAANMPVGAVTAIKAGHYRGPLYNTYDWGGYLIWDLRMPVSIDGRANIYGDQRLARETATWSARSDWNSDPYLAAAGIVIAPSDFSLAQVLRFDSRFELVYEDKIAVVFVRKKLQNQPDRSDEPSGPEPSGAPSGAALRQ